MFSMQQFLILIDMNDQRVICRRNYHLTFPRAMGYYLIQTYLMQMLSTTVHAFLAYDKIYFLKLKTYLIEEN